MSPLNYNHLFYFFTVAKCGSISGAAKQLHLTPQTISGQIGQFEKQLTRPLFNRQGKRLQLNSFGQTVFQQAERIFALGDQLQGLLTQKPHWHTFTVGMTDVVPKMLALDILRPIVNMVEPMRLICVEGDQDSLLAELAIDKLDMILTDQPLPRNSPSKACNHQLVRSGFTFFASQGIADTLTGLFPENLIGQRMLVQSKTALPRQRLDAWLEKRQLAVQIVAEFDDSALMKSFGEAGYGIFTAPSLIEQAVVEHYKVQIIGKTIEIDETYYAICPQREFVHPATVELLRTASEIPTVEKHHR